jgi:hypothetical protein
VGGFLPAGLAGSGCFLGGCILVHTILVHTIRVKPGAARAAIAAGFAAVS